MYDIIGDWMCMNHSNTSSFPFMIRLVFISKLMDRFIWDEKSRCGMTIRSIKWNFFSSCKGIKIECYVGIKKSHEFDSNTKMTPHIINILMGIEDSINSILPFNNLSIALVNNHISIIDR